MSSDTKVIAPILLGEWTLGTTKDGPAMPQKPHDWSTFRLALWSPLWLLVLGVAAALPGEPDTDH